LWPSNKLQKNGSISRRSSDELPHAEFATALEGHAYTIPRSFRTATFCKRKLSTPTFIPSAALSVARTFLMIEAEDAPKLIAVSNPVIVPSKIEMFE
jgi:hypothetical protein